MRFKRGGNQVVEEVPLTGSFLVAHPSLLDASFKRSVVLLTAHSPDEGAVGVVVNRPSGQTLGEWRPEFKDSGIAQTPLYYGGPVESEQLILAAWKWCLEEGSFKLYFGVDEAKALQLREQDPGFKLYGFLGHAGWGEHQLESELEESSWVVSPLLPEFELKPEEVLWRQLLLQGPPEMRLLIDEPEDPSLN
jgi:putative transcriptional regulator